MKNLKVTIAQITERVNANTVEKYGIVWKRKGLEFIGETKEDTSTLTALAKNLRNNAIKLMAAEIKKGLNEIEMDCDFVSGINGETEQFYIRLNVKDLPFVEPVLEVVTDKATAAPKPKTTTVQAPKTAGVIQTILDLIKKEPQTQASILDKLVFTFPDREAEAMKKTVSAQLGGYKSQPTRMEKEKKVTFEIKVTDKAPVYSFKTEVK